MDVANLCRDLVSRLGFGEVAGVGEDSCELRLPDATVAVTHEPKSGVVRFRAVLGVPDEQRGHGLLPEMLRSNCPSSGRAAGALAIDGQTGEALLLREDRMASLDLHKLESVVSEFGAHAAAWSAELARYNAMVGEAPR